MKLYPDAYVGILRTVNPDKLNGPFGKDHPSDDEKIKWVDLLEGILKTCKEYVVVFPKDLPTGLPPKQMRHEFKIDSEPKTTPIFRPIYKLSPLELQEAKNQIGLMLEHGFIGPS